jgi:DNA-binding beta-propeller fold protein YncE
MDCLRLAGLLALISAAPALGAEKVFNVAGGGTGPDGSPATQAKVVQPFAVEFVPSTGAMVFVEMVGGERLRMVDAAGVITTLAGTGKKGDAGDGGPADKAEFNGMHNLLVAPDETVYLADTFNNRIRKYDPKTKTVSAFAGTGKKAFGGDGGPADKADFNQVICIAFGPGAKTMYVADIGNSRVRAIDMATGTVTTFAGNGQKGEPKDGAPATEQPLQDPRAVAADDKGNVYVLERSGHRLRVVGKDGRIRTVAGTGKPGKGGDGGPALSAPMNGPKFLAIDRDGSVLIADTENHQIRRYVPGKELMELVAGTGKAGKGGIGEVPAKLEMARPHGVTVHPKSGELYIADSDNGRVLRIVKE